MTQKRCVRCLKTWGILRNCEEQSEVEETGGGWGMQGCKRRREVGGGCVTEWWQRERERTLCVRAVCVCARVPRHRQTLAALSELTGPSPLPLLVAQGGRDRKGEEMEDSAVLTNSLKQLKAQVSSFYAYIDFIPHVLWKRLVGLLATVVQNPHCNPEVMDAPLTCSTGDGNLVTVCTH